MGLMHQAVYICGSSSMGSHAHGSNTLSYTHSWVQHVRFHAPLTPIHAAPYNHASNMDRLPHPHSVMHTSRYITCRYTNSWVRRRQCHTLRDPVGMAPRTRNHYSHPHTCGANTRFHTHTHPAHTVSHLLFQLMKRLTGSFPHRLITACIVRRFHDGVIIPTGCIHEWWTAQ